MTSISQPVFPPQAPNNPAQSATAAHSPSASTSGRAPSQAAGTASATAKNSYASATKKTFSPPVSGNSTPLTAPPVQHGKQDVTSSGNGKVAIPPAVPAIGASSLINGSTAASPSSGVGDHSRKPSVTISAAGASGHMPNGGPVVGKPKSGSNIQFGQHPEGSPASTHAASQSSQSANSLAVNAPSNPRVLSPQTSPSPIPQPPASGGGRPPSSLHGNSSSVSFGNFNGAETNLRSSVPPQGPLALGSQPSHLRRESSQSQHSDMSSHGMGPGGKGGYANQGGRGRGGNFQGQPPYQQQPQMGYPFPGPSTRPPNQPRNGQNMNSYQGQNRNLAPYPNSPHQGARSPALANSQPAHTPQSGQIPIHNPQIGQHQYGYPVPFGYPPNMGPAQVNPQSSSSSRNRTLHGPAPKADRLTQPWRNPRQQALDLSPSSGNFDQYLTMRKQGQYAPPQGYDPNFMSHHHQYYGYNYQNPQNFPPGSPRPPHQMPSAPQQQQYNPGQYANQQQPSPMSRTSSAVSHIERPSSSVSRPQTGNTTPAVNSIATTGRQVNSPGPKSNTDFKIPEKKARGAVLIKNPDTGNIVTFEKPSASPAPGNKSQAPAVSSTPTPPPRAPSTNDGQHSRTESKTTKTDEEKRNEMRETIAKKMEADKLEAQRQKDEQASKAAQEQKLAEEKALKEREDADAKQREAAASQARAEEALAEEKAAAKEAEIAASKAKEEADEAAEKARKEQEQEDEIARMEAEYAEKERLEAEAEERYQQKKKADAEEAARKAAEALKMEDEDMKKAEREAEEAEEARLKELEKNEGGNSQKERANMFAALKKDGSSVSTNDVAPAVEAIPSDDNESSKPLPDMPAPPAPAKGFSAKQKPAALKLETSKPIEPAQPSAALLSLRSANPIQSIKDISYPDLIKSPNPALNTTVHPGKFRYNMEFLMQFENVFKEKPSENWTERIKETLGDTTEPSSARATPRGSGGGGAMMTGRQPSNRAPMPAMGAFAQGGRTLPPGTSSQQRYEAATAGRSAAPVRPTMTNPLQSFVSRAPGGFPQPGATGIKMDRTPSSTSLNHPNSPRNASQRGGSQRGSRAAARREDPKDNKAMPLTAGANLKPIEVTASGWKPRSIGVNATGMAGPAPGGDGHLAPDVVQRKVKGNLNKMTPNNFDKITLQILEISAQSKDESDGRTLRQVIQLTFEKATDEAHWAEMYAQFCKRMLESMSPEIKDESIINRQGEVVFGGALFRKYLLNRCQEEFERGWKLNLPERPEGETEEAAMLSDEYYIAAAAKRRGLGLVRFIGELYKLSMLTERIMHECVKKLVDYEGVPDEAEVESLTNLLKTIGQPLDSTEKGPKMMDAYFMKINEMVGIEGLPSRLKFMLMDIIDLRKNNWKSKGGSAVKGPTTLEEVRAQAVQADREKEMQRQQDNARKGGGGGGRPPLGRGDARNFSGGAQYGMMPPPDYHKNTVAMEDLKRLGSKAGSRQVSSQGQPSFGPTSMFGGPRGSNSRRPGMAIAPKDDSGASSRTGTPPAQKEKKEKEEKEAAKSANSFGALAALESSEATDPASPPSTSPPVAKSQPAQRQRSTSPKSRGPADADKVPATS